MTRMWIHVLLCFMLHSSYSEVDAASNPRYAIHHREHFDSVTLNSRGRFLRATLLVLYTEECIEGVKGILDSGAQLPPAHHLLLATHDYKLAPSYAWFQLRDMDRLEKVYDIQDCFSVLFFRVGYSAKDKPAVWNSGGDVVAWVWNQLQVPVKVRNQLEAPVKVEFVGAGPQLDAVNLQATEERELKVFTSYFLSLSQEGSFKSGGIVFRSGLTFTARRNSAQKHKTATALLKVLEADEKKRSEKFNNFMVEHEKRVLVNVKQPHIFPNFTTTGFKKTKMPAGLHDLIRDFFHETRKYGREEQIQNTGYINTEERLYYMVHFDLQQHVKQAVPGMIQPELEAWCDCQLELAYLYGVREYRRGHVLHNHVDHADGHVISAVFQIDKDLNGQEDWPLEITDYDGVRHDIFLEPGEMVMIESGKVIHGRIIPFQGRGYANAFIHFIPKGWSIINNGTHIVDPDHGIAEKILEPVTPLTTTKPLSLSPPRAVKDEL